MVSGTGPSGQVIFLLGAGASKDAGLPTSANLLTDLVPYLKHLKPISNTEAHRDAVRVMENIHDAVIRKDPGANIEDFLSVLHALAHRENLDVWAFTAGLAEPLRSIVERQNHRHGGDVLRALYEVSLDILRRKLDLPTGTIQNLPYLEELISLAEDSPTPSIYTLNYDLTVESQLERLGIPYSTGFRRPQGVESAYLGEDVEYWPFGYQALQVATFLADPFLETADGQRARIRLVKVHGSLDWFLLPVPPVYEGGMRLAPEDRIVRSRSMPREAVEEIMIVGRGGKERLQQPFPTLLREFYRGVLSAEVVVIIGYSFSDEHINQILLHAQLSERFDSFDLIVVNGPEWPKNLAKGARRSWDTLLAAGRQAYEREALSWPQVIPEYAKGALVGGALRRTIAEVLDQRRTRMND